MPLTAAFDEHSSALAAQKLPLVLTGEAGHEWKTCGEGVFSWSIFKFYRIRLLTKVGTFDPELPYLLELSYLRKISAQQIITTSLEEITRLGAPCAASLTRWAQALEAILPDVGLGDRLLGWFTPSQGVRFFSADTELGAICDPDFVRAFAAIWLDPGTQRPALRLALLGNESDRV